jgi:hypothetical protein
MRARFRTDLVEGTPGEPEQWLPSFMARVWKMHGSLNWMWEGDERRQIVRLGRVVDAESPAAIYPSDVKYDESRRVPFLVLQDQFRRSIQVTESLVLVIGYSFGDFHLNEIIFDAARRRPRSEFIAFCFDDPSDDLAKVAVEVPNLQVISPTEAIIGGRRAEWTKPDSDIPNIWVGSKCVLSDFNYLAQFLSHSGPARDDLETRLSAILAEVASSRHE